MGVISITFQNSFFRKLDFNLEELDNFSSQRKYDPTCKTFVRNTFLRKV